MLCFRVASAKAPSPVSLGAGFGILREQLVSPAALIAFNVRKLTLTYAATSRFGLVIEPRRFRPHTLYQIKIPNTKDTAKVSFVFGVFGGEGESPS